ncbi:MAG: hypothetical protein HY537_01325 [Deltaproteobacteria bacterium]|nr:hypothetical protein [Deltaproteobacteria bacterium]
MKDFVFFEEAKHPVLSFEAWIPVPVDNNHRCSTCMVASPIYLGPPTIYQPTKGYGTGPGMQSAPTVLLNSVDLTQVDMFGPKFNRHVMLAMDVIQREFPKEWKKMWVSAAVCDDRDGNGKCTDEKIQLSVSNPSFKASTFPCALVMEVWSGRHLTLSKNPDFCEKQYSPLVLDLTGEGVTLSGPEDGVRFDLNDTGTAIITGWVAKPNLAFLVRDLNRNGRIDSGAELFGSATKLENGLRALNGFEALKELDSDDDGTFTANDAAWKSVKLWLDRNFNGQSDKGEIVSLNRAGIESINLKYADVNEVDSYGNETRQRSTFRRNIDGRSVPLLIIDVWFNTLNEHEWN